MSSCKYQGAGVASSKPKKHKPSVKAPAPPPMELQELPRDILHKIFMVEKALQGAATDTYSEQLLLAANIDPKLALTKEAVAPETMKVFYNETVQTFTNVADFQAVDKRDADFIKMTGKSVHVLIPKRLGFVYPMLYINIVKPGTTTVLASLTIKYMHMQKNPAHIIIHHVSLKLYLYEEDLPEIDYITDIIVGASWLSYVFNTIQCISSFTFSHRDHIIFTKKEENSFDIDISVQAIQKHVPGLINRLLLLLQRIEENLIQSRVRIGGSH